MLSSTVDAGHTWWLYKWGSQWGNATYFRPAELEGLPVLDAYWICVVCGEQRITNYAPHEDPSLRPPHPEAFRKDCRTNVANREAAKIDLIREIMTEMGISS